MLRTTCASDAETRVSTTDTIIFDQQGIVLCYARLRAEMNYFPILHFDKSAARHDVPNDWIVISIGGADYGSISS